MIWHWVNAEYPSIYSFASILNLFLLFSRWLTYKWMKKTTATSNKNRRRRSSRTDKHRTVISFVGIKSKSNSGLYMCVQCKWEYEKPKQICIFYTHKYMGKHALLKPMNSMHDNHWLTHWSNGMGNRIWIEEQTERKSTTTIPLE